MSGYLSDLTKCVALSRSLMHQGLRLYRHLTLHGIKRTAEKIMDVLSQRAIYAVWILNNEPLANRYAEIKRASEVWHIQPLISVLMPTFNSNITYLEQAIASVRNQAYPYWQLCIADDASSDPAIRRYLQKLSDEDERIIVSFRQINGHISAASNTALHAATGDWVALLDHDDLLHPLALYCVAEVLQSRSDANLIYSDEDKISSKGRRYEPYFKGQYNRELMWAQNVVSHLGCYRRSLVMEIGGFRLGYEGSQDYDLALRVIEHSRPEQIIHIPRVLYHWRAIPGSTALAPSEKNYASPASREALRDHLERIGIRALVEPVGDAPSMNRVKIELTVQRPTISVLLSTKDRPDLLDQCIRSIRDKTAYENIEIIVVESFDSLNLSELQNRAAKSASGEYLCMMNSNIEVNSSNWLEEMLSFAQLPEIGTVGARLINPDADAGVQHVGLVAGLGGVVGYAHRGLGIRQIGYFGRAVLHQRLTAVTQYCMLIRKDRFIAVGGFDERLLGDFADLDLSLRLRQSGYSSVLTPYSELFFHALTDPSNREKFTNPGIDAHQAELVNKRWGDKICNDPYYSPNLSLEHSDYRLARCSRVTSL
jgi:glycosyltransferase involved in cell wall biosynthesis